MNDFMALIRGHIFKIKCTLLRKRVRIGKNFLLKDKVVFDGDGLTIIGDDCTIAPMIGTRTHYTTFYTHDKKALIRIGDRAQIYAGRISSKFSIWIGDDFIIEEACIMDTNFHNITPDRSEPDEQADTSRVLIGSRVSVGVNSIISKGSTVLDDTIIQPGSIISKNKRA
jgi:acetyltransferase-like isoleucine patch superfamily enzyme